MTKTLRVSEATYARLLDQVCEFGEREEDVIRRLLDEAEGRSSSNSGNGVSAPEGSPLVSNGGRLPHGTELRATYKGAQYHARVEDGRLVWDGQRFKSPSGAAVAVIQSTGSNRTTEDGWRFWSKAKIPGRDEWEPMEKVRKQTSSGG